MKSSTQTWSVSSRGGGGGRLAVPHESVPTTPSAPTLSSTSTTPRACAIVALDRGPRRRRASGEPTAGEHRRHRRPWDLQADRNMPSRQPCPRGDDGAFRASCAAVEMRVEGDHPMPPRVHAATIYRRCAADFFPPRRAKASLPDGSGQSQGTRERRGPGVTRSSLGPPSKTVGGNSILPKGRPMKTYRNYN